MSTLAAWTPAEPRDTTTSTWATTVAVLAGLIFVITVGVLAAQGSADVVSAPLIFLILLGIGLPIVSAVCRRDDANLVKLAQSALALKLAFAFVRFATMNAVYGFSGDSEGYNGGGRTIASQFHAGQLSLWELIPRSTGTDFLRELTGLIYVFIGSTMLGGFVVFSFFSFWGLFLCWRAACRAVPELDRRRYLVLVMFVPSFLFWPSSIGKDAWMVFALGVVCYGVARVLTAERFGYLSTVLGLGMMAQVRPHLTVILAAALGGAFVFRKARSDRFRSFGSLPKILGLLALLVVGLVLVSKAAAFLPKDKGAEGSGLSAISAAVQKRTAEGGSEIAVANPVSITGLPVAEFTVYFRPTLLEARSITMLVAALESTGALVIIAVSWRRVLAGLKMMFRRPYLLFCFLYCAAFGAVFSVVGNLGILARQRVQALPILFVFVAITVEHQRRTAAPSTPTWSTVSGFPAATGWSPVRPGSPTWQPRQPAGGGHALPNARPSADAADAPDAPGATSAGSGDAPGVSTPASPPGPDHPSA